MAEIVLINPPIINLGKVKRIRAVSPPLGLLSLASFMESNGFTIQVVDLALEPERMLSLEKDMSGDVAIVGITATTNTINSGLQVAKQVKKARPDLTVVLGGPHPSVLPEEVLKHESVDFVAVGEGEISFQALCSSIREGKPDESIPGIGHKIDGEITINGPQHFVEDLDSLPFPARHTVPFQRYYATPINYKRWPSTPVITTRGCPFKCTFCSNPVHGRKIRYQSPEKVIDELKHLKKDFGIRDVAFWDDTFTLNKDRVEQLCGIMLNQELNLTWSCATRVDTITQELLQTMKKAGCWQISFGVESGVDRLRKKIQKNISEKQIKAAFANCRREGIETRAFFMIGLPTETRNESMETIHFAKKLNPDFAQFTLTVPYPGCELYDEAVSEGWEQPDWEQFQTYPEDRPVYVPAGRDGQELTELQNLFFKSFYLRPSYIFRRLWKLRSWEELKKHAVVFLELLRW